MGTPSAAPRTRMRHEGTMHRAERHPVGWVAVNSFAHGRRVIRRHGRTAAAIIGGTSQSAKGCWALEQQAAARPTPFESCGARRVGEGVTIVAVNLAESYCSLLF